MEEAPITGMKISNSSDQHLALVLKGGSVKGLAYVGALKVLEKYYSFNWYIGTSAGAIAAVLLAAGYTTSELEKILLEKSFRDFLDARVYRWLYNLIAHKGLFPAYALTDWIQELLSKKLNRHRKVRLCDLPNRVTIYASSRDEETLVFDSHEPARKKTYAAFAVRCSVTIPYIFIPQTDQGTRVLDGGMRNNYPVKDILSKYPGTKFIGLYLGSETNKIDSRKDHHGLLLNDLIAIWTESSDWEVLEEYKNCTVIIDPGPITSLRFKLSEEEKNFLIKSGQAAALCFLAEHVPTSNVTKEEAEKARDEVAQERARLRKKRDAVRKRRIAFTMLILIILATGASVLIGRAFFKEAFDPSDLKVIIEPPPCELTAQETRVDLSNLSDWTKASAKWSIDLDSENIPTGRVLVRGTPQPSYPNSLCLRNFSISFNIVLETDEGAAWALRVKDERNYYLFYLSGPKGLFPNKFCAYIVRDGNFDIQRPINPANVVTKASRGAQYVVRISVNNNEIKHLINPSNVDPTIQGTDLPIHIFQRADDHFHYGSIGFLTVGTEEFSIGNIVVRPTKGE